MIRWPRFAIPRCRLKRFFLRITILALLLAGDANGAHAAPCPPPAPARLDGIAAYLAKRYHLGPNQVPKLIDVTQANEACFWKLHFDFPSPKLDLTIFLSPDQRYLTGSLYDVDLDPSIDEIRRMKERMVLLTAGSPPSRGPANAPVTIVEFEDFECPFCKQLNDTLNRDILPEYGDRVRIVFRQFPLRDHPWARDAAVATVCAARQGNTAFWQVSNHIFAAQQRIQPATVRSEIEAFIRENPTMDWSAWSGCLGDPSANRQIDQDIELGRRNGVDSTPTLIINGVELHGAVSADVLRRVITAGGPPSPSLQVQAKPQ